MSLILDSQMVDFISNSVAQTRRLGARLGELVQGGEVICLEGNLGTGKTIFAQGVAQGLGIDDVVTSPTFTLLNEYRTAAGRPPLYHIDLYRVDSAADAHSFGFNDYLYGDGVCVIEWAEKLPALLPLARLWLTFRHVSETKRGLLITANGEYYSALLNEFKRLTFGINQQISKLAN